MSDLPPEALTYQSVIAEYFLGLRGAGLMLSPLDLGVVSEWERRGLPVAVVCRGLRSGLESFQAARPTGAPPRSLRAYRLAVEDEWRAYRSGILAALSPAAAPQRAEHDAALARLSTARRRLASDRGPGRDEALLALAHLGGERLSERSVDEALARADHARLRAWIRALLPEDRRALGPACIAAAGPRGRAGARAYRAALQARLWDFAREAGLVMLHRSV